MKRQSCGWSSRLIAFVVGATHQLGCGGPTVTYRIRVREPSEVAVSSPTAEVLPAATTPTEALLARGSFASGEASSTSYEAFAAREPDGGLILRWGLVRVLDGDRRTLVAPDGLLSLSPSESDDTHFLRSPADRAAFLDHPRARLHLYATLDSAYSTSEDSTDFIGYNGFLTGEPAGVVNVPVTLDTPWSNVVEVRREERQHKRMASIGGIVLTTFITGIVGGSLCSRTRTTRSGSTAPARSRSRRGCSST